MVPRCIHTLYLPAALQPEPLQPKPLSSHRDEHSMPHFEDPVSGLHADFPACAILAILCASTAWSSASADAPAAPPTPPPAATTPAAPPATPAGPIVVPDKYLLPDRLPAAPAMAYTTGGLYLLSRGILDRLDPDSLADKGTTDLFGPPSDWPAVAPALADDQTRLILERAKRLEPCVLAPVGADLVAVIGDQFVRVNAATGKVLANRSLVAADQVLPRVDNLLSYPGPPPQIADPVTYRLNIGPGVKQITISAIRSSDGFPLAEMALPKALTPEFWTPVKSTLTFGRVYELTQDPPFSTFISKDALYILRGGAIVRMDPQALDVQQVVELFGPPPTAADTAPENERDTASIDLARRYLPAVLISHGADLLVVMAGDCFDLDAATLAVKGHVSLIKAAAGTENQRARIETLADYGMPQVVVVGTQIFVVYGKRLFAVSLNDGSFHEAAIPDALTRLLPVGKMVGAGQPPILPVPLPPPGSAVAIQGVVQRRTGPDGRFWTVRDCRDFEAVFVLTGAPVADLAKALNGWTGVAVVTGKYQPKVDGVQVYGAGVIQVDSFGVDKQIALPVRGTVTEEVLPSRTVWTIKTPSHDEFVILGDQAKVLVSTPGILGRQVLAEGAFYRGVVDIPDYGTGCLMLTSYTLLPSIDDLAAQDDKRRPLTLACTTDSVIVIRNGIAASIDPATLAIRATRELLPALAPPPGAGFARKDDLDAYGKSVFERTLPVWSGPPAKDLALVLGGQFYRLDPATLEIKAHSTLNPFNIPPAEVQLVGDRLAALYPATVVLASVSDGSIKAAAGLPKQLLKPIFPVPAPPTG